jgi:hypothetical protein
LEFLPARRSMRRNTGGTVFHEIRAVEHEKVEIDVQIQREAEAIRVTTPRATSTREPHFFSMCAEIVPLRLVFAQAQLERALRGWRGGPGNDCR